VRAQTLARRRRTAGFSLVLAAVVLLAMPLHALGAVTVAGQPTPAGAPAGLAPGSVYVVQPGDTLRSIASQVNPAELGVIEHRLATSIGSTHVVAGEHVIIP
jgi:LysM repeat protein